MNSRCEEIQFLREMKTLSDTSKDMDRVPCHRGNGIVQLLDVLKKILDVERILPFMSKDL